MLLGLQLLALVDPAHAQGTVALSRVVPGERLSDWLLREVGPDADTSALHWRVPAERAAQDQLRRSAIQTLQHAPGIRLMAAQRDALADWLLALLPAQWASTAIQTALTGSGTRAAGAQLLALAGTGAVTLLVARLLPRRWPYALMFTAWLGLSALVLHAHAAPHPDAGSGRHGAASSPTANG
jgi:hypothetical protein